MAFNQPKMQLLEDKNNQRSVVSSDLVRAIKSVMLSQMYRVFGKWNSYFQIIIFNVCVLHSVCDDRFLLVSLK